ncbi:MAG: TldD/PmbA family protein [Candidatus Kariarchaeaceae archaeon]
MIDIDKITKLIDQFQDHSDIEFIDTRIQNLFDRSFTYSKDQSPREINNHSQGIGVRVFTKTGYAFSSGTVTDSEKIIKQAVKLANITSFTSSPLEEFYSNLKEQPSIDFEVEVRGVESIIHSSYDDNLEISKKIAIGGSFPDLLNYRVELNSSVIDQWYLNSIGSKVHTVIPKIWSQINLSAIENHLQSDFQRFGHVGGMEIFDKIDPSEIGKAALSKLQTNLKAISFSQGTFPIIASGDLSFIIAHEVAGHMVEADSILKEGMMKDLLGKKIASEECSLVDDGTLRNGFGYSPFDDEGVKTQKTFILEFGLLSSYLHSRATAAQLGQEPTGNGRAMYYYEEPIPRMTNTYFTDGEFTIEEMIEDIKEGIFCEGSRGGATDPIGGQFCFNVEVAHKIVNGEIGESVRNVCCSGNTSHVLREIKAVEKDRSDLLPFSFGFCGKEGNFKGQKMTVGAIGPAISINQVRTTSY